MARELKRGRKHYAEFCSGYDTNLNSYLRTIVVVFENSYSIPSHFIPGVQLTPIISFRLFQQSRLFFPPHCGDFRRHREKTCPRPSSIVQEVESFQYWSALIDAERYVESVKKR